MIIMNNNDYTNTYMNRLRFRINPVWVMVVIIFFSCSSCMALNSTKIELLLDSGYFPKVKKLITDANSSIRMIMFEASYYKKYKNSPSNQLINALIDAKKRGLNVEVILDVREKSDRTTKRNLVTGARLKKAGIDVVIDSEQVTTHSKLLIVDENTVVIGSTNWTYNALTSNHESSVMFDSKETAAELLEFFEKIKKSGKKL